MIFKDEILLICVRLGEAIQHLYWTKITTMKEHLKTDSLRLGETDSFPIDYLRWPELNNLSHDAQKSKDFHVWDVLCWDVLCWMILNHTPSPQKRHLLSRPLSVVTYMCRDGWKLVFLFSPLDVAHNNGLRKAINPCDISMATVCNFTKFAIPPPSSLWT